MSVIAMIMIGVIVSRTAIGAATARTAGAFTTAASGAAVVMTAAVVRVAAMVMMVDAALVTAAMVATSGESFIAHETKGGHHGYQNNTSSLHSISSRVEDDARDSLR